MINTQIVSGVCLVCINHSGDSINAVSIISDKMRQNNITLLFVSTPNIFTSGGKIYVAVYESDIINLMKLLGELKITDLIINYSINCSNSMIRWESDCPVLSNLLKKTATNLKLIISFGNDGVCFCDNAYSKNICSLLSSCGRT